MQSLKFEATLAPDQEEIGSEPGACPPFNGPETALAGLDKDTLAGARQVAPEEMAGSAAKCLFCRYRGPGMGKVELS